ncbi:MAG: FAD-dependent oxidoreductase [Mycoplasmataceae bacterium]|nr:FAD-dependent oxidoreductase [Mycoplasmataceae bacterium]
MKVVLVGVNHSGTSMVRTLKTLNKDVEINAYDRNTDISFLGCGIALWVGGEFEDPEGLFYANKEILENDFGTNVKMEHDVIEINAKEKYVVVKDLKTGETFKDEFDKLVFAGGTWPITIPVEGNDLKNIYFSKIFAHAKEIKKANENKDIKNVVVLGAGYIGIELLEAFHKAGKKVTLVDMADRVIPRYFDHEFTTPLETTMKEKGIHLAMNEKLVKFEGKDGKVTAVVTDKGTYKADMVLMSVGFKPLTGMLKDQVEMTKTGAIIVNEHQQSSNKDIYAIGDSCAVQHHILGTAHVALATNAVKTGIVSAFHLAGNNDIKFPGVNGTNAIAVFDYNYASTGISETSAQMLNIDHKAAFIQDKDRPEFMHDAADVSFKIVYDPKSLKLIGAQIGSRGAANHTEVIYAMSLAISKGMTLPEIALMDVFFLPHFNKPFNYMIKSVFKALGITYADNN